MSKKSWTVGDQVAVLVIGKRAEYYRGQIGLDIEGDDFTQGNNFYVSVLDAEEITEGGVYVLERTVPQRHSTFTAEWKVVT